MPTQQQQPTPQHDTRSRAFATLCFLTFMTIFASMIGLMLIGLIP